MRLNQSFSCRDDVESAIDSSTVLKTVMIAARLWAVHLILIIKCYIFWIFPATNIGIWWFIFWFNANTKIINLTINYVHLNNLMGHFYGDSVFLFCFCFIFSFLRLLSLTKPLSIKRQKNVTLSKILLLVAFLFLITLISLFLYNFLFGIYWI